MHKEQILISRANERWQRRNFSRLMAIGVFICAIASYAAGQSQTFAKKDAVILKFPKSIAKFEKIRRWIGIEQNLVTISETSPGKYALNGELNWDDDFSQLTPYLIRDFNLSNKKPSEIILSEEPVLETRRQIKILIPASMDVQKVLSQLLFKGTSVQFLQSDYFIAKRERLLPTIFRGPLKSIPVEKQRELIMWAGLDIKMFGFVTFKEKEFLSIKTDEDVVYNTLQLNQAERTSRQTQHTLKRIKELIGITGPLPSFHGIQAWASISSYNFVRKDDEQIEQFEMYIPFDLLKKFLDLDITDQALVDSCVVLIDGSRVKVNLTNF